MRKNVKICASLNKVHCLQKIAGSETIIILLYWPAIDDLIKKAILPWILKKNHERFRFSYSVPAQSGFVHRLNSIATASLFGSASKQTNKQTNANKILINTHGQTQILIRLFVSRIAATHNQEQAERKIKICTHTYKHSMNKLTTITSI